ncbi:hypothetical protein TCAL_01489 [Tigriopus californicus]|uniref:Uncharacterized protein n=1 Tax=Tigriopus californicus TaxID=6832 RepID=A0A553N6X8_TIGCA|nr:hypothetical protein TCAL_01489 [Tigriopus californicus]
MVLSQCARSLDLSRRRVAAITFLANIQVHDESHQEGIASEDADPSDDHTITEIRLDCLQKTHVLKDFQDHKRLRHERFRGVGFKLPPTVIEPAHNVNEHEKIARKLTFGQTENKLFAEEREEEIYNSTKHLIHIDEHDEPLTPRSRTAPDKARLEVNDNLLHLDLSNVPGNQPAPRSAPPGAIPAGTNSLSSQNSKLGFNFAPEKHSSHEQLPESRNMYSSKRKLTYQNKTDEIKTFNLGSSNESLSFIPSNLGARLRKISGNLSENSSTSNRDLRAFRTDDEKPTGNERFVLVTPEKRTPFAVVSIIPFHKNSRAAHRSDRDHNKRTRTNSGARQFSLIHDGFDFNDIMLGEKLDESQIPAPSIAVPPLSHPPPTLISRVTFRAAHLSKKLSLKKTRSTGGPASLRGGTVSPKDVGSTVSLDKQATNPKGQAGQPPKTLRQNEVALIGGQSSGIAKIQALKQRSSSYGYIFDTSLAVFETSYSHLLHPTTAEDIERREAHFSNGRQSFRSPLNEHPKIPEHNEGVRGSISCGYSPHELDGWLIAGKHRTFLPFPSYVVS